MDRIYVTGVCTCRYSDFCSVKTRIVCFWTDEKVSQLRYVTVMIFDKLMIVYFECRWDSLSRIGMVWNKVQAVVCYWLYIWKKLHDACTDRKYVWTDRNVFVFLKVSVFWVCFWFYHDLVKFQVLPMADTLYMHACHCQSSVQPLCNKLSMYELSWQRVVF